MSERGQQGHFEKSQAKILEKTQNNGRGGGRKIREGLLREHNKNNRRCENEKADFAYYFCHFHHDWK